MIGKYIRSKYKSVLLFALFLGVFCLVSYLYRIPADALIYACVLCLFFAVVFMIYSYCRYRQKAGMLEDIRARVEFGPEELPRAANDIEAEYQAIIRYLYTKTAAAVSMRDKDMTDMLEYYTMWVHQIKTPIAAMGLLLQSEQNCPSRDAMQLELFKIEQYVEMVLQYLRLGEDSSDFLLGKVQVDKVVREAVKKYSTMFIKRRISLRYEGVEAVAMSDEKWLSFVVEQLLSNALKYTPPEGTISIYMDPALENTLVIEDTGIGIQAEDLPRVFDKGYTGYNGRNDKKSTGIGLYLCRQIVGRLGHGLTISSEVGKGTKVKLGLAYKSVRYE